MRRRLSLAGQLLAFQLLVVLVVLVAVAAVSIAQSAESVRRAETRRATSAAENVAATPLIRQQIETARPRMGSALPAAAEKLRTLSGAKSVILALVDGTILTSSDPAQIGTPLAMGDSQVVHGRAWNGLVSRDGRDYVSAQVPIFDLEDGQVVGVAAVEREYPSTWDLLAAATPNLATYLGIASILGVVGSLLLARRVKRQTMGLEPRQITRLVEHREAMLHGVKEGLIALDPTDRITLVNDSACALLGISVDDVGRTLDELAIAPALADVLSGREAGPDRAVLVGDRMLILNRQPMSSRGRDLGSVTTLRDRTELTALERKLDVVRNATETLRAQTHEHANRLHVISGLVQLGEYDEVVRFIDSTARTQSELSDEVTGRIEDPALAALLIAKSSLADERGLVLRLAARARLGRVDESMSVDLTTVVGNLIDNGFDAVGPLADGWVEVDVRSDAHEVVVIVTDSGPGVSAAIAGRVFERGFSTKLSVDGEGRGLGLALVGLVCSGRGGSLHVHNEEGAVFTARLPLTTETHENPAMQGEPA